MIFFAGSRRIGLFTVLAALLLPALGVGVASADMSVGDTVMLKVPDLSQFPSAIEEHQFTCRAVTTHAYWLVQDTISVKTGTGPGVFGNPVWDTLMTQGQLDTLTGDFEGNGVDVYGTVTEYLGDIPDTDDDPRVWIVFATITDFYNTNPGDRQVMVYVNPEDVDGSGSFNNHDIVYINVHSYSTSPSQLADIARWARLYNVPTGLGELLRTAVKPNENPWVTRGLGAACQYLCYGLTTTYDGNGPGLLYDLKKFKAGADIELTYWQTGKESAHMKDYALARGAEFTWMMYMAQRFGDSVFNSIAQSDTTSMLNMARAIDSSVPDDVAIQTNVVPIYNDWLICNLVNDLKDESFGGIYTYDIIPGDVDFGCIGFSSSFAHRFGTATSYPIDVWIADEGDGMMAPIWAGQYVEFAGDYADYPTMYFNGMYSDDGGSGTILNGKWTGQAVVVNADTTEILSIDAVTLNDFYTGSFELSGGLTYLVTTNNNEGGQTGLRYVLSQDTDLPYVLLSAHQNTVNDQYITLYTTLYDDGIPEGFDWYGPIFHAITSDSSGLFGMSEFYETIWSHRFTAWEAGAYTLQIAGYDSTGFDFANSIAVAVDYVTSDGATLSVNDIHLNVAAGAAAPGTMLSMCESSMLGLAIDAQTSLEAARGQMTGILAGPVSIPSINAVISFPAENSEGAVYNYTADGWIRLESWYQSGRMSATVTDGGNYAFGSSPGVSSPEIPGNFRFGGTYPNPFSAEAAISFSLPSTGHVNVTIYDMTGRAIRTLTDTEMMAAQHSLIWDGLDETGHAVGAGVYFCRLQACGETVTQKMLRIE